jgi:exodeoxyribonuclease VIII
MKRNYLSVSALKAFAKSPNHYLAYVSEGGRKQTPAMLLGEMVHAAVLEPDEFHTRYQLTPENLDRRTKEGKETYHRLVQEANSTGRKLVDYDAHVLATTVGAAVQASKHPVCQMLPKMLTEQTVEGELQGVPFKGIIDAIDQTTIIEVKTTTDASAAAFTRDCAKYDYHLQAAAYLQLTSLKMDFAWIVVETVEPFNVAVYRPHPHSIEMAGAYLTDLIERWKEWDGSEGGYPEAMIQLPNWHPAMQLTKPFEWL